MPTTTAPGHEPVIFYEVDQRIRLTLVCEQFVLVVRVKRLSPSLPYSSLQLVQSGFANVHLMKAILGAAWTVGI